MDVGLESRQGYPINLFASTYKINDYNFFFLLISRNIRFEFEVTISSMVVRVGGPLQILSKL